MNFPTLTEMQVSRDWTDAFGGYNHNLRISDAEFFEMTNMTGDNYPTLSSRRKRGVFASPNGQLSGLISKDSLCYIEGSSFVINGESIDMDLSIEVNDENVVIPKKMISMGAYVIILPDKKYINTNNLSDRGDIEASYDSSSAVAFKMSMSEGTIYSTKAGPTPPAITDKMLTGEEEIPTWIDTSSRPHEFKVYSTSTETWSQVVTTYVRIEATNIGKNFNVNDGVEIKGITAEGATLLNGSTVIVSKGDDYITVSGMLSDICTQEDTVTVKRSMPDMDFVIESGNRLWGCFYGIKDNQVVNEIYASKPGDFRNWNSFQGTAADSYAVSVGTDGEFTGAVTHLGYPIFFKENYMHKIYGNYPANYQVQTTACRGVQSGCWGSIATVNNVLYYKARSGICAYDGSLPVEISAALGDEIYDTAVGGGLGNKYYISMRDAAGVYHLFVYDTKKRIWHREDSTKALAFANCRGDLYFINYASNQVFTVGGTGTLDPDPVEWEAVTGTMGTNSPDKKYISRIDVRMQLEIGARVSFYAEYDSSGEWRHLFNMDGRSLKSFSVPIRPQRCDHLRLKIVGRGDARIFSICKTIEWGSSK